MQKLTPLNANQIYAYQRQLNQIQQYLQKMEQGVHTSLSSLEVPYVKQHIAKMKKNIQEQRYICETLL